MATISLLAGCATTDDDKDELHEVDQPADTVVPEQVVRSDTPIELLEAFWNKEEHGLFLRYLEDDGERFGVTYRYDEQDLTVQFDWVKVFYMQPSDPREYKEQTADAEPIRVLPAEAWREMRVSLADTLVPRAPNTGILLNSRDKEFFAWRNEQGELQIAEGMVNKPREIPMTASYRVETLDDTLDLISTTYLDEKGIDDPAVIFSTGETGAYARPFALFVRETGIWYFISLEPFTFGSMPHRPATNTGKTAWNVGRSYWWEFYNRPVSFIARLAFFLGDTAWDLGQGISIRAYRYPDLDDNPIPPLNQGQGMDLEEWERVLDRKYGENRYPGKAKLLIGGDQFFPRASDVVMNAKESIKLRTYIFDNDDFAVGTADVLKARSKDIRVQIMVDGLGTQMAQNTAPGMMPEDFNSPVGITNYLREDSNIELRVLTNPWFTGDHSKTSIIDSEIAFVGGMNIGREYRWEWHDMMVELDGPVVEAIEHEFDKTWAHAAILGDVVFAGYAISHDVEEEPARKGDYDIRILTTLPRQSEIYRAQLNAIKRAEKYIWIQNAYFASTMVLYELVKARLRGVDVRVILPMAGNHGIMNKANVVAANTLIRYGARVFVYNGMSHIKAAIFDDWACLGSANFDKLSFRVNKELNLGFAGGVFVNDLKQQVFEEDMKRSVEMLEPLPENWGNTWASIVSSQL